MGLETLFQLYKDSTKSRLHEIFICFHSFLLERNLLCVGKGGALPPQDGSLKGSELLPAGWNDDTNTVELFYMNTVTKIIYKVIALTEGNSCLVHLISARSGEDKSAFIEIDLNEYVNESEEKTLSQVYKNVDKLRKVVIEQLVDSVVVVLAEGGYVPEGGPSRESPPPEAPAGMGRGEREGPSRQYDPLRDYGRADVDPFYVPPGGLGGPFPAGGGGMIFDPLRNVRPRAPDRFSGLIQPLPRGAVPPGARFDPFGPPGTGFPDPDLEKKPDFNDDFYS